MDKPPAVLIAAASGRALAASARRGGYAPLVADYFGDTDTVALAELHVRLDHGLARGMAADTLLPALEALAVDRSPIGIVCGTGFEDRPDLLARIAARWPLLGNNPDVVARAKDPLTFATFCRECDLPHPEISVSPPADPAGWLVKRRGGSGGQHVTAADRHDTDAARYFQRRVAGTPISTLVLCDGRRAMVLGFSTQWASPTPARPFRYGGAVRPATLAAKTEVALADAAQKVVAALSLAGLNSVDFLVEGDQVWLLEVNPRPGATLDIFEPHDGSLFALHVAACGGVLPATTPVLEGAAASAIVYAAQDIPTVADRVWPDWTADRPRAGTAVGTGDPLCTVLAFGPSAAYARQLVNERVANVLAYTG